MLSRGTPLNERSDRMNDDSIGYHIEFMNFNILFLVEHAFDFN